MTRHHLRLREPGWRRRLLVFVLIRLNREYRLGEAILEHTRGDAAQPTNYARHKVFIFVDTADLAVLETLRYARNLRGSEQTAVHFMIDRLHAERLRQRWQQLRLDVPLRIVDCPDRRLTRAAQKLVTEATRERGTGVTVVLPRRTYAPVLGRLLHDRTADRMAKGVSQLERAAATIVPYDVQSRIRRLSLNYRKNASPPRWSGSPTGSPGTASDVDDVERPAPPPTAVPIDALRSGQHVAVEGRLRELRLVDAGDEP